MYLCKTKKSQNSIVEFQKITISVRKHDKHVLMSHMNDWLLLAH